MVRMQGSEGGSIMEKKIKKWLDKGLTTAAKASVNSASFVCFYEPEISENLKNCKQFNYYEPCDKCNFNC